MSKLDMLLAGLPARFMLDTINPFALTAYSGGFADCEKAGGFCPDMAMIAAGVLEYCRYPAVEPPSEETQTKFAELLLRRQQQEEEKKKTADGKAVGCGSVGVLRVLRVRAFPSYVDDLFHGRLPLHEMEIAKVKLELLRRMPPPAPPTNSAVAGILDPQRAKDMATNASIRYQSMESLATKLDGSAYAAYMGAMMLCARHGTYCPMMGTMVDGIVRYCVKPRYVITPDERADLAGLLKELMAVGMEGGGWGIRIGCAVLFAGVVALTILSVGAALPLALPASIALIATMKDGDGSTVDGWMG